MKKMECLNRHKRCFGSHRPETDDNDADNYRDKHMSEVGIKSIH